MPAERPSSARVSTDQRWSIWLRLTSRSKSGALRSPWRRPDAKFTKAECTSFGGTAVATRLRKTPMTHPVGGRPFAEGPLSGDLAGALWLANGITETWDQPRGPGPGLAQLPESQRQPERVAVRDLRL